MTFGLDPILSAVPRMLECRKMVEKGMGNAFSKQSQQLSSWLLRQDTLEDFEAVARKMFEDEQERRTHNSPSSYSSPDSSSAC